MSVRPVWTLSCIALAVGATCLRGQSADPPMAMPSAAPPAVAAAADVCPPAGSVCPPAGSACPPKSCSLCAGKSFCEHLKCALPAKCAPAPRVTVIVPKPEVVVRHTCPTGSKAPTGLGQRTPTGVAGAGTPVLVPQVSYTMQPVVQQVVTMQAVPTVSYGLAVGVNQSVGVGVGAVGPTGFAPTGFTGVQGVTGFAPTGVGVAGAGGVSDAEFQKLLQAVLAAKAAGAGGNGAGPSPVGVGAAGAAPTVAELDAHIKLLEADIVKAGQSILLHEKRLTDVEAKVNNLMDAVKTANEFKDFKATVTKPK